MQTRHIGLKEITTMDLCEVCVLGKAHRLKFATTTHRSNDILEYIHLDLWGSPKVPLSLSNAQYLSLLLMISLRKYGFIS